jgi:serine/threonine-protein kinase RsbW
MEAKHDEVVEQGHSACGQIELHISSNPEYLRVVRLAVRQVALVIGFEEKTREMIALAVEEALTNVIRHSYGGPCDEQIVIKLNRINCDSEGRGALEVTVRDFGRKVDPETIKCRNLDHIKPGGLGVHLIKSVMDDVEYCSAQGQGMVLRMKKYLS